MTARVYVPATLDLLRGYAAARTVPAGGPERYVAEADDEESEYAALMAAAADSAALGGARRVVLVAEVADPDGAFGLDRLVAVHADTADRPDAGDAAGAEDDLGWFAVQEIPALLR